MRVLLTAAAGIDRDDPPIVSVARLHYHLVGALGMDEQAPAVLGMILGLPQDGTWQPPSVDPLRLAQLTARSLVEWLHRLAAGRTDDRGRRRRRGGRSVEPRDPGSARRRPARRGCWSSSPPTRCRRCPPRSPVPGPTSSSWTRCPNSTPRSWFPRSPPPRRSSRTSSEQILRQGEGVPLYLEELARTAQEADGVRAADRPGRTVPGAARLAGRRPGGGERARRRRPRRRGVGPDRGARGGRPGVARPDRRPHVP